MGKFDLKKLYTVTKELRILYVEDDTILQKKMAQALEELFLSVECCSNGVDALKQFKSYYQAHDKFYDLVITDIKMPQMDGLELCKKIRQITQEQKIVVTSAYDDSD